MLACDKRQIAPMLIMRYNHTGKSLPCGERTSTMNAQRASVLLLVLFVGLIASDAAQLGFVTPSPAPDALASLIAGAVAATLTALPGSQPTAVPPATLPPGLLQ